MSSVLGALEFVDPAPPRAAVVPAADPRPLAAGPACGAGDVEDVRVDAAGRRWRVADVLGACAATSLLVARGRAVVDVVHEWYADGVGPATRLLGASATKSALAHLVGRAVARGELDLDLPVARYAPEAAGWAEATVGHVLAMSSGADWAEDHRDPDGPASRLVAAAFSGRGSMRELLGRVGRAEPPGRRWVYSTADSQVLDLVRERATGRAFADDLALLWAALGCEQDALVVTDAAGVALAGGGLACCARDWLRLGALQVDGVGTAGAPLLEAGWLARVSRPAYPFTRPGRLPSTLSAHVGFGGHWWPLDDDGRRVAADGSRGQFVLVDRELDTVVVMTCRWPFDDPWHDRACRDLAYLTLAALADAASGLDGESSSPRKEPR